MKKNTSSVVRWMAFLALFGVVLSVYSLLHKEGFTSGAVCNLNDTFNCDVVNQGPYSDLFGIPVALMGIIGYGLIMTASLLKVKQQEDKGITTFLVLASLGGFGFALYLSGIEAFVLQTWCIVCLGSQTVMTAIMILALVNYRNEKNV